MVRGRARFVSHPDVVLFHVRRSGAPTRSVRRDGSRLKHSPTDGCSLSASHDRVAPFVLSATPSCTRIVERPVPVRWRPHEEDLRGTAVSMTVFPIVPDFERYPEYGRDLDQTFGEIGLARHWIKILLHVPVQGEASPRLEPHPGVTMADTPASTDRPHLREDFYATKPTGFTVFLRSFLPWQLVRFAVINLKMLRIIHRSHAGD